MALFGRSAIHVTFTTAFRVGLGCRTFATTTIKLCDQSSHQEEPRESVNQNDTESQTKQRILNSALQFVHEHGWTKKALAAGAESEGLPPVAHGLFPRGGIELVNYLYITCNRDMGQKMATQRQNDEALGVEKNTRDFIKYGLLTRLRMIIPYLETWPQAMAMMALPQNAPESWGNLCNLADEVWHQNDDRSTDFNWYTKRLTLSAVYKTSELHLLQDQSEDYTDTEDFLDRRLQDALTVGKVARQMRQSGDVMNEGMTTAIILAKNMLGMNDRFR